MFEGFSFFSRGDVRLRRTEGVLNLEIVNKFQDEFV